MRWHYTVGEKTFKWVIHHRTGKDGDGMEKLQFWMD
jgi:hypothetical protein